MIWPFQVTDTVSDEPNSGEVHAMFTRWLFATVSVLAVAASAQAQQPAATAYDRSQDEKIAALQKDLSDLKKRLTEAETGIAAQKTDLDKKLETLTNLVAGHTGQIGALSSAIQAQTELVKTLSEKQNTLTTGVNKELEAIRQNLADISRTDSARGHVPRLDAAMESPSFRQDMDKAVHASLKATGKFEIVNKTISHQWIFVNRTERFLRPNETIILEVPVGTVTTQLPGQELVNWTVAAPEYSQSIEIVPLPTPTRTVIESPSYLSSPGFMPPTVYGGSPIYSAPLSLTSGPSLAFR
jgi:hypothetical protein